MRMHRPSSSLVRHLAVALLLGVVAGDADAYPTSVTVVGDEPAAGVAFDLLVSGDKPTPCYDLLVDLNASGLADDDVPTVRIVYTLQNTASSCITVIEPYEFTYSLEDGLPEGSYVVELVEGTDLGPGPPVIRVLRATFTVGAATGEVPARIGSWSTLKSRVVGPTD